MESLIEAKQEKNCKEVKGSLKRVIPRFKTMLLQYCVVNCKAFIVYNEVDRASQNAMPQIILPFNYIFSVSLKKLYLSSMELVSELSSDRSNEFYMWAVQIELKMNYSEIVSKIENFSLNKRKSQQSFQQRPSQLS